MFGNNFVLNQPLWKHIHSIRRWRLGSSKSQTESHTPTCPESERNSRRWGFINEASVHEVARCSFSPKRTLQRLTSESAKKLCGKHVKYGFAGTIAGLREYISQKECHLCKELVEDDLTTNVILEDKVTPVCVFCLEKN